MKVNKYIPMFDKEDKISKVDEDTTDKGDKVVSKTLDD